jgi:hypothetical protein
MGHEAYRANQIFGTHIPAVSHIRRDPLRLVLREQLGGRSPAGLILEIGELLVVLRLNQKIALSFCGVHSSQPKSVCNGSTYRYSAG